MKNMFENRFFTVLVEWKVEPEQQQELIASIHQIAESKQISGGRALSPGTEGTR